MLGYAMRARTVSILLTTILFLTILTPVMPVDAEVTWSDEMRLTTNSKMDLNPSIAQMSDGRIWVLWESKRVQDFNIYYKIYNWASWTNDMLLISDPDQDINPSIIQADNGTIWVFWSSNRMGNYDVFYETSSDNGATWSDSFQATSDPNDDTNPAVVQAMDGTIWVVWGRNLAGYDEIFYRIYDGFSWSSEFQLTTDPTHDRLPSITATRDGRVWVFWCSNRTGVFEIFYRIYDGFSWSSEFQFTESSDLDRDPTVVQDRNGTIWVVWTSHEPKINYQEDLYYKFSSDNGMTWSDSAQLTSNPTDDMWASIAQMSDKRIWVVLTSDRDLNYEIYYKTSSRILANDGPKASNLLVHVYANPDVENEALEAGEIDINDWPLSKYWVDRWAADPDIDMRGYSEVGYMEFDVNNQAWPTGVSTPRTYDSATGTYKHFYGMSGTELAPTALQAKGYHTVDDLATAFRTGIACLTDKDSYVTEILKGLAYRQDTEVPVPATAGWTNYGDLSDKGLIYPYDPGLAADVFDHAGFVEGSTANPYYDSGTPGSVAHLRIDPLTLADLEPLEFWIRMDDPNRRDAGWMLVAELQKAGIQVNAHETEKTVCYKNVMVNYDFHIYTGGWSLSMDVPDSFNFLSDSVSYWGGTETSEKYGMGWSSNYNGFCNNWTEADSWYHSNQACIGYNAKGDLKYTGTSITDWFDEPSYYCKYGVTFSDVYDAGLEAQEVNNKFAAYQPLWAAAAVKAFDSDWTGLVNMPGYGIDNTWSFLNMYKSGDNTIDYGAKSGLEGPHPICAEWVWDWNVIGMKYDSLIGRNPYNLAEEFGWLAKEWTTGTWTVPESGEEAAVYTFTLRPGILFHNGDPLTPQDVKFSYDFTKACGPGVAWVYSDVKNIHHVTTKVEEPALGTDQVKIYMDVSSYWALHWAGMQVILNMDIWMAASTKYGWGYTYGMNDYSLFTNRIKVREYAPWDDDADSSGVTDYKEDATGPWVFESATPLPISTSTAIAFKANTNFYLSQDYVSNYLSWALHCAGDVDNNGKVDSDDGYIIAKSMGTTTAWPHGTGWYQYNAEADIGPTHSWNMATGVGSYGDGAVDVDDGYTVDHNFGMVA